ncbi:MAG: SpaA isopeptide-forming pilin-related protein [Catonella sp.]
MWKNVKFKRGALSILLIIGLVFTNFSPLGAWAGNAEKDYLTEVQNILKSSYGDRSANIAENLLKIVQDDKKEDLLTLLTSALKEESKKEAEEVKAEKEVKSAVETNKENKVQPESKTEETEIKVQSVEEQAIPAVPRAEAAPVSELAKKGPKKLGKEDLKKILGFVKADANVEVITEVLTDLKSDDITDEEVNELIVKAFIAERALNVAGNGKELQWDKKYILDHTVTQTDNQNPEGNLDPNRAFRVEMRVNLPIAADANNRPYLKKGDYIRIPMARGVKITGTEDLGNISAKYKVNGQEKEVKDAFHAKAVMDGNTAYMVMTLLVDNKEFVGASDIVAKISMDFSVDLKNIDKDEKGRYIASVDKKFYIGRVDSSFTMTKNAKIDYNKGKIDWEIKIEKIGDVEEQTSLAGYKFEDPIVSQEVQMAGEYVPKTFRVCKEDGTELFRDNLNEITKDTEPLKFEPSFLVSQRQALTYIFPDGTPGKVIVNFSTDLKKDSYNELRRGFKKVNTAYLYAKEGGKYGKELVKSTKELSWNGTWGVKTHGGYAEKNRVRDILLKDHLEAKGMIAEKFSEGDEVIQEDAVNGNYKLQWNVFFDATDKNLKNVKIKDDSFPIRGRYSNAELKLTKWTLRKWDADNKIWLYLDKYNKKWVNEEKAYTEAPAKGIYEIGDLNTIVKLTIWSEVKGLKGLDRFSNLAHVTWDDGNKWVEFGHDKDFGEKLIDKKSATDVVEANPTWKIKVNKKTVDENKLAHKKTYVYDTVIDTIVGENKDVHWHILADENRKADRDKFSLENGKTVLSSGAKVADLVYRASTHKMSFDYGSFKDELNNKLSHKVYPIYYTDNNGTKTEVGKIIEVTGFEDCANTIKEKDNKGNIKSEWYEFSFRTNIIDAEKITGGDRNEEKTEDLKGKYNQISNLAYLYEVDESATNQDEKAKRITFADAWPSLNHRMVKKDAVPSEVAEKLMSGKLKSYNAEDIGLNNVIEDKSGAYVPKDKSVIFRISLNAAGVRIPDNRKLEAVLRDALEGKFKIVNINDKHKFLIYKGTPRTAFTGTDFVSDAFVRAEGDPLNNDDIFSIDNEPGKGWTLFRFKKLEVPYVLFVRAKAIDDVNSQKVINEKSTVYNLARFIVNNVRADGTKEKEFSNVSQKTVEYDARFLSKEYTVDKGGIIRWTIVYDPSIMDPNTRQEIEKADNKEITLYDELEKGLNVFSKDGKPALDSGFYTLYDENGKNITSSLSSRLTYKKAGDKDTLTLKIPNDERLKKVVFSYDTIKAQGAPAEIRNTVRIKIADEDKSSVETATFRVKAGVEIESYEVGAEMTLKIKKTDADDGKPIKGVKFELVAPDGKKKETLTTDDNGEASLSGLTETVGDKKYTIKEIKADGYQIDKNTYSFNIERLQIGNKITLVMKNFKVEGQLKGEQQLKLEGGKYIAATNKKIKLTCPIKLIKADAADYDKPLDKLTKLDGAEFRLVNKAGSSVAHIATTENGELTFVDVEAGTYILSETKAPTGYAILAKPYEITVTPGAVKSEVAIKGADTDKIKQIDNTIVVFNEKLMDLDLYKADLADKDKSLNQMLVLGGAKFKLTSVSDAAVTHEATTATDGAIKGKLTFKNLKAGTYILKETEAPTGYAILAKPYEITVTPSAVKSEVAIKGADSDQIKLIDNTVVVFNEKIYDLKIVKADLVDQPKTEVAGATLSAIAKLNGAKFNLALASDETVSQAAVLESGEYTFKGLKKGKYKLIEENAPQNYNSLINSIEVDIDPNAAKSKEVIVSGDNAKFFDNAVVVFNERQKESIELNLIKADMAGINETEENKLIKLQGAKFTLVYKDDQTVSSSAVMPADGKVRFAVSKAGIYTLTEEIPPTGYAILAKSFEIAVTPGAVTGRQVYIKDTKPGAIKMLDKKTNTIVVFNEKLYDLNLLKADLDVNAEIVTKSGVNVTLGAIKTPLSGARFRLALASDSAVSYSAVTGENGSAKFTGLKSGTYVLTEEAAPSGYNRVTTGYAIVVTASAVKPELEIKEPKAGEIRELDGTVVVFNKKTPYVPYPIPDPDPTPGPSPSPDPSPNPNPNPPTPTTDLPRYPENNFPDPNDPGSPDEFVAVDDDGTPQGKYVKSKKPDGTNEYIPVDEDGTPLGVNKAKKKLPKTGGSDTTVYYAGGAILLILAAGVVVFRRKKYNR